MLKVSSGFSGRPLGSGWFQRPEQFRPGEAGASAGLRRLYHGKGGGGAGGGCTGELACSFFWQVLEAVRPSPTARVLHRHIRAASLPTSVRASSSSSTSGRALLKDTVYGL